MPSLRRGRRSRAEKHKPEVVTGNFELHYEDIIQQNRLTLVAVFATGLLLLAAFIPSAVNRSIADPDQITVEAEHGVVINPELVTKVDNDITASDNSYIEFRLKPAINE